MFDPQNSVVQWMLSPCLVSQTYRKPSGMQVHTASQTRRALVILPDCKNRTMKKTKVGNGGLTKILVMTLLRVPVLAQS